MDEYDTMVQKVLIKVYEALPEGVGFIIVFATNGDCDNCSLTCLGNMPHEDQRTIFARMSVPPPEGEDTIGACDGNA